ncbi:hypothetical protein HD806DRAFT_44789 [Xylariaceae sp. AK1471]|nr:hypothetical protein HD806DRAFT_44789 [Xylariaceae sp. AK1471]
MVGAVIVTWWLSKRDSPVVPCSSALMVRMPGQRQRAVTKRHRLLLLLSRLSSAKASESALRLTNGKVVAELTHLGSSHGVSELQQCYWLSRCTSNVSVAGNKDNYDDCFSLPLSLSFSIRRTIGCKSYSHAGMSLRFKVYINAVSETFRERTANNGSNREPRYNHRLFSLAEPKDKTV